MGTPKHSKGEYIRTAAIIGLLVKWKTILNSALKMFMIL